MSKIKNIYTIGYEGASINDFIGKLKKAKVDILIDARLRAGGRKLDFCKNNLMNTLHKNKIEYKHYKGLGTPPYLMAIMKERGTYSMDEYAKYLDSNSEILHQVTQEINASKIALMCFERDATNCHRSVVASRLSKITKASVSHL